MAKESTIIHYTSSTTGNTPAAADIATGELAINVADERIFFENIGGTVLYLSQTKDLSGAFAPRSQTVSSVNGLTGTITLTGDGGSQVVIGSNTFTNRIAGLSVTGVASFDTRHFAVGASGHVSLTGTYQVTGQTVVSGGASQLTTVSGNTVTIDNRIAGLSVTGVASFDTRHFAVGASGHVSLTGTYQVTGQTVVSGGGSVQTTVSGNTVTLNNRIAATAATGVASFDPRHFAIGSSGHVSLTGTYQVTGQTVVSGGASQLATVSGNTVTIDNRIAGLSVTGVASFDPRHFAIGSSGHVSLTGTYQVTGDTVAVGGGLVLTRSSNTATVANSGVLSLNGLTGAATITGDGFGVTSGAVFVVGNNTITARIASASATGVASFNIADFGVGTTGTVSLTGNIARTSAINTFTATNIFNGGISANAAITGNTITAYGSLFERNTSDNKYVEIASRPFISDEGLPPTNRGMIVTNTELDIFAPSSSIVLGLASGMQFGQNGLTYSFNVQASDENGSAILPSSNSQVKLSLGSFNLSTSSTWAGTITPAVLTAARTYTLPDASGTVALANTAVSSLNGLTGARTLTGDGGGVVGVGNNAISARLASISATGVASFNTNDFGVGSTAYVSLTGTVARTNSTNTFTSSQTFNAGITSQTLYVSQGTTFAGTVASDTGYRITSNAINGQTGTSYTLTGTDNGKIVTCNNGSAVTVTIPSGLPVGYNCTVIQLGAGQVGFTAPSGVTMNAYASAFKIAGQHGAATVMSYTTNFFNVSGTLIV